MKRLFIAINLPQETKNTIKEIVSGLKISINQHSHQHESAAEIRFLPMENWHLTVVFLGYQPDETIGPILESMKKAGQNFSAPLVEFEKIILAPPNREPRMVWLCGTKETSKSLGEIKKYLENELIENGVRFQLENRPYNAHLTLARFQPAQINADAININPVRNNISNGVNQRSNKNKSALTFQANSIDLMESYFNPFSRLRVDAEQNRSIKRAGAEYEILTSINFLKSY